MFRGSFLFSVVMFISLFCEDHRAANRAAPNPVSTGLEAEKHAARNDLTPKGIHQPVGGAGTCASIAK